MNTFILKVIIIGLILLTPWNSAYSNDDPFPNVELPVCLKGDIKVKHVYNKPYRGLKSISYVVNMKPPATEVVNCYNTYFRDLGWVNNSNSKESDWSIHRVQDGEKIRESKQFIVTWSNLEIGIEAKLVLRYLLGQSDNKLHIVCQIAPKIDSSKLQVFINKLIEKEEFESFRKIIEEYRLDNGYIEIDRAINKYPNDENLQEYRMIQLEMEDAIDNVIRKAKLEGVHK